MIPPIERILDVKFSYKNLCNIFSPILIKTETDYAKTLQVLQQFNSRLGLKFNLEKPLGRLSADERRYIELLEFLCLNYNPKYKSILVSIEKDFANTEESSINSD